MGIATVGTMVRSHCHGDRDNHTCGRQGPPAYLFTIVAPQRTCPSGAGEDDTVNARPQKLLGDVAAYFRVATGCFRLSHRNSGAASRWPFPLRSRMTACQAAPCRDPHSHNRIIPSVRCLMCGLSNPRRPQGHTPNFDAEEDSMRSGCPFERFPAGNQGYRGL